MRKGDERVGGWVGVLHPPSKGNTAVDFIFFVDTNLLSNARKFRVHLGSCESNIKVSLILKPQ